MYFDEWAYKQIIVQDLVDSANMKDGNTLTL